MSPPNLSNGDTAGHPAIEANGDCVVANLLTPTGKSQQGGAAAPETRRSRLGPEFLNGKVTITVEEAASIIGIGRSSAYEAARRGEIPVLRIGRRLIVPVPALRSLLGMNVVSEEHNPGDVEE